jgi:hypothetical protein
VNNTHERGENSKMKLKKRYTIEYIDNLADLKILESGTHPAPWEIFKKSIIEEPEAHEVYTGREGIDGKAWMRFILWSLCPEKACINSGDRITHPLFCQMYLELIDGDGNIVYEDRCDLPQTAKNTFLAAFDAQVKEDLSRAQKTAVELQSELDLYRDFVQKFNANEQFRRFKEENHA